MTAPRLAEGLADYLAAVRPPPGPAVSLETSRLRADLSAPRLAGPRPVSLRVTNSFVVCDADEVPVRLYHPAPGQARPAIVYFHGGGFTTGSIASYDALAGALAVAADALVVSVHYARLPEATPRFALEQGYAALCWTARVAEVLGAVPGRLAVAGDSAGAFLATHLAMLARDRDGPAIACQLLAYGLYDLDPARPALAASRDPVLTPALTAAIIAAYRASDARDVSLPAPLAMPNLTGLPPAVLLGAEHDALLDEAHEYADRLRAAGVAVTERIAPAMCHGFLRATGFSDAVRAEMRWLGAAARDHLTPEKGPTP